MPTVMIWRPDKCHTYGHAALQTKRYHMSFYPDGDIKADLGVFNAAIGGVQAALIFHHDLDAFYEGHEEPDQTHTKRVPEGMYELVNVTDDQIDRVYEKFLCDNDIQPNDVSLDKGKSLADNQEKPEITLKVTRYTYLPEIFVPASKRWISVENVFAARELSEVFTRPQSCVSFCYHMIEMADPNPQFPFKRSGFGAGLEFGAIGATDTPLFIRDEFRIDHFEELVKNNYLANSNSKKQNDCIVV